MQETLVMGVRIPENFAEAIVGALAERESLETVNAYLTGLVMRYAEREDRGERVPAPVKSGEVGAEGRQFQLRLPVRTYAWVKQRKRDRVPLRGLVLAAVLEDLKLELA